jgi:gluconolactonase
MKVCHVTGDLQFPEGQVAMDDASVLLVESARGTLGRVTPGQLIAIDDWPVPACG